MKTHENLADAMLDYLWFLEFSDDEDLDPDATVKGLENVSFQIENIFSSEEKQSLSEAAKRRMAERNTSLTDSQREFLQVIADGDFSGSPEDEES